MPSQHEQPGASIEEHAAASRSNAVPHQPTLAELEKRCDALRSTTEVKPGELIDIHFPDVRGG